MKKNLPVSTTRFIALTFLLLALQGMQLVMSHEALFVSFPWEPTPVVLTESLCNGDFHQNGAKCTIDVKNVSWFNDTVFFKACHDNGGSVAKGDIMYKCTNILLPRDAEGDLNQRTLVVQNLTSCVDHLDGGTTNSFSLLEEEVINAYMAAASLSDHTCVVEDITRVEVDGQPSSFDLVEAKDDDDGDDFFLLMGTEILLLCFVVLMVTACDGHQNKENTRNNEGEAQNPQAPDDNAGEAEDDLKLYNEMPRRWIFFPCRSKSRQG